ncbi:PilZ domain-containing protein [Pseudoalteromonas piscicida]|uniref:PilZ domain-containing protein n=1 Tax=Pseudoalteromonas piscicida TaxID=43662 RepID=UPI0027E4FCCE|nr:PilZ domain-containing protein [Pseudoalteromonas piscicida]WMO13550.1 PilZ domain-containing protein [Pseudoalteromonas piscicida]
MKANLQESFEQYFQIAEQVQINLYPVDDNMVPENEYQLEAAIPPLFKLANEINELDLNALRPLRNLGDIANELAAYLQAQSRKIDLIISHILATEEPDDSHLFCDSYGGGGLTATLEADYEVGQSLRTKIFLRSEASAIFCYSEVIAKQDGKFTLAFTAIREADQELLVRASLHAQTRQLKLKQQKDQ